MHPFKLVGKVLCCSAIPPITAGHLRKLASDCFMEDNRSHLLHRGICSRSVEVNLKPTEVSKAGKALHN